jgi:hypothetical protein
MFVILNDAANLVLYAPIFLIALGCCGYLSYRFVKA